MKHLYFVTLALVMNSVCHAQCGTVQAVGTSGNMFTHIRNSTNPVAVDKNLNTVVFIHRNNNSTLGGNNGQLRYDVSTNGGSTWTTEIGVMNPTEAAFARYPNITIHNPTNNVNPAAAYVGYMAATIHTTSSAWNGCVTGVAALGNASLTENYNQPVTVPQLIAHSLVKGAPGVYWACDALYNGSYLTGFTIYKGTWNNSLNDITWVNNFTVTPNFNTNYSSIPIIGDYNIAFDPTGQKGWFSFLSHLNNGPSNYAYYPVFYKTVDGGVTWTGPIQVDLNTLSCLTGNMSGSNVVTTNFEHDLAVDVDGNPHLFTTICNGNNAYSVIYSQWHHMFDITLKNGLWVANDVANVMAGRATWGTSGNTASLDMEPQIARTADGTKIFYTWADNTSYSTVGTSNTTPNLQSRAFDVVQNKWTMVKDFTSCNSLAAGKALFPHTAAEVLEPSTGNYKLATVYAEFTGGGTDPIFPSNFNFLNNCLYSNSEFTINTGTVSLTITNGPNILLCPGSTVNVNVTGAGQAIWSNSATTTSLAISQGSVTTYSVIAQVGCLIGTGSIAVTNMTFNATNNTSSVCPNGTVNMSVSGNASTYSWMPGSYGGTSIAVIASVSPMYTVSAYGTGGCFTSSVLPVSMFQNPTVAVAGTSMICTGKGSTVTASGASTYSWNNGNTNNPAVFLPTANTTYSVLGTDVNGCTGTATFAIVVNPLPTITATSNQTAVCYGNSVTFSVSGANSYSWQTGSTTASAQVQPSVTATYTVEGSDLNNCKSSTSVSIIVNPLPTVNIVSTRTVFCKSEKPVSLVASGAQSYTWVNGPTTVTYITLPIATTVYTLVGVNNFGCIDSTTFQLVYSTCTGLNEESMSGISMFPNPSNGEFELQLGTLSGANICIYDVQGRQIRKWMNTSGNILVDMGEENPGVYLVDITAAEGRRTLRLVLR